MFTAQTVRAHFSGQIDETSAQTVADLMNGAIAIDPDNVPDRFPETSRWCWQCHNPPSAEELALSAINETIGGFGVEGIADGAEIIAEYVNTGDTYSATVLRDCETGEFILTTWGDFYQGWTEEQNEQDGTIDCGYCSHRTPLDDSTGWRDTVCESCGHKVDGSD